MKSKTKKTFLKSNRMFLVCLVVLMSFTLSKNVLALDINASWSGKDTPWQNMSLDIGSDPFSFNVVTPQDQIDFRHVDLSIYYCVHSKARILLDGNIIMQRAGSGSGGGCYPISLDPNYDLGVLSLGNHTFNCQAMGFGGWNTSANCRISTPTFCGDDAIQTPNSAGTGGPANDGNEQCDKTDDAVCGIYGCSTSCVCNAGCTLTASPASINSGGSSNLTWSSSAGAVSGSINQGVGNVAVAGGMSVSPAANTLYTLTVVNADGGTGTCTAMVTVTAPTPPPPDPNACGIGTNVLCNPLDPKVSFFADGIMVVVLFLLSLAGIVTLTSIVIAGIKYITSAGNEERMKSAKSALLSSGLGLVIILLAYTILSVVHGILNG